MAWLVIKNVNEISKKNYFNDGIFWIVNTRISWVISTPNQCLNTS